MLLPLRARAAADGRAPQSRGPRPPGVNGAARAAAAAAVACGAALGAEAAAASAPAEAAATTGPLELLGLQPAAGPLDGGTTVWLDTLGAPDGYNVSLWSVSPHGRVRRFPTLLPVLTDGEDGPSFVTPNLSSHSPDAAGVLVSLQPAAARGLLSRQAGPALFRVFAPLATLTPAQVRPCCEFKISGGEPMTISCGPSVRSAPARRALVRFRGAGHHHDAEAEVHLGRPETAGGDDVVEDGPLPSWHLRVTTPAWPRAEGHISLEVSWDRQQFSAFWAPLRFVEEESFFGAVAAGVSEEHLARAAFGDDAAPLDAGGGAAEAEAGEGDAEGAEVISVAIMDEDGDQAGAPRRSVGNSRVTLVEKNGDSYILSRANDLSVLQEDTRLVHDLFLITIAATVSGVVGSLVHVPSIIAFIIGGAVVGPGGLNGVVELVQVESVAQLGVCLLLFCLGLEFSWPELVANTRAAAAGLLSIVLLCGFTVFFAAFCMQTPVHEALCIGLFASLSSTPMSLKAIPDQKAAGGTGGAEASILLAVLVTQDMVLAGLLAVLPGVLRSMLSGSSAAGGDGAAGQTTGLATADPPVDSSHSSHVMAMVVVAQAATLSIACFMRRRVFVRLDLLRTRLREWVAWPELGQFAKTDSEFFTLLALSYAFALSNLTHQLGLSVELGAFAAGLSIASYSPDLAHCAHDRLGSLRETLVALFFASIGLVVNPHFLLDNLPAILSVVGFIFVLKAFCCFLPLWLLTTRGFPEPKATALRLSCVLAHVGEFGFVLAAKSSSWGALPRHVYLLLVGTNAVSLCLAPWCFRLLDLSLPREVPRMMIRRGADVRLGATRSHPGSLAMR